MLEARMVKKIKLIFKVPSKIAADDTLFYFLLLSFLKKTRLVVSVESSALTEDSHEISSLI